MVPQRYGTMLTRLDFNVTRVRPSARALAPCWTGCQWRAFAHTHPGRTWMCVCPEALARGESHTLSSGICSVLVGQGHRRWLLVVAWALLVQLGHTDEWFTVSSASVYTSVSTPEAQVSVNSSDILFTWTIIFPLSDEEGHVHVLMLLDQHPPWSFS